MTLDQSGSGTTNASCGVASVDEPGLIERHDEESTFGPETRDLLDRLRDQRTVGGASDDDTAGIPDHNRRLA